MSGLPKYREPVHPPATSSRLTPLANRMVKFLDANGVVTSKTADFVMVVDADGGLYVPQDNRADEICALLERIADRLDVISSQLED